MEEVKVEQVRLRDGRYGEIKTSEQKDCDSGQGEVVYEHFEEEPRQLHLKRRVTEKRKPVVYERVTEAIEGSEVVERKVESLEPNIQMQLREHIGLAKAQAQSEDPCYATCQDLKDALLATVEAIRETTPVATAAAPAPRVRMQEVVEETTGTEDQWGWVEFVLLSVIGVEAAWIAVHIVPKIFHAITG